VAWSRPQRTPIASSADSAPPGPGANAVGLGIFRYTTPCGVVYGHTGNTLGYTQFIAATADGTRSLSVSVSTQISATTNAERLPDLEAVFGAAVCAALAR
jgi:D-alanyl-D-alanine carboxypeptidase